MQVSAKFLKVDQISVELTVSTNVRELREARKQIAQADLGWPLHDLLYELRVVIEQIEKDYPQ